MRVVQKQKQWLMGLLLCISALTPALAEEEVDSAVYSGLKAWGEHPFGKNPEYKTLSTAVKVFGIGRDTNDAEATAGPAPVLVNPGVNVAGGKVIQVLNPNGWYCFRTTVNVMGTAKNSEGQGVSAMGATQVERIGCD